MNKWLLFIALLLISTSNISAFDFKSEGLFYMKSPIMANEAWVTDSLEGDYQGHVIIPEKVIHNDTTYTVTAIMPGAFSGCYKMQSVTLPATINAIGSYAFNGCLELTSITIPENVEWIGTDILQECNLIRTLIFNAKHLKNFGSFYTPKQFAQFKIDSLVIGDKVEKIPADFVRNCEQLSSIIIPASVDSIGNGAFSGCMGLKQFKVASENKSFQSIDGVLFNKSGDTLIAFPNLNSSSYNVPKHVKTIGIGAFANCANLCNIVLPESLEAIQKSAFWYCRGLINIILPKELNYIGELAFAGCSNLKRFEVNKKNQWFSTDKGILFNKDQSILLIYPNANGETFVTPRSVKEIGTLAFAFCDKLYNIKLSSNIIRINNSAFNHCSGLKSVELNEGIKEIGKEAFANSNKLTDINLPFSLSYLGDWAFGGCTALKSIKLTSNIDSINPYTFHDCLELDSLIIGDHIKTICDGAFYGCKALKNIIIPDNVVSIKSGAFYGCDQLESIILGNSVKELGYMAFAVGENLKRITCLSPTPPTCSKDTFFGVDANKCTLIVNPQLHNIYKENSPWNLFNIQ